MWDFLEFIFAIGELLELWRFYACFLLSLALVGLIYWLVPEEGWRLGLSIPTVVIGIGVGLAWDWRER